MDSLSSDRRHFPTTRAVAYGALAVVLRITCYLTAPVRIIESSDNRGSDNRGSTHNCTTYSEGRWRVSCFKESFHQLQPNEDSYGNIHVYAAEIGGASIEWLDQVTPERPDMCKTFDNLLYD